MIEKTIQLGSQWAVFEPNDHRLWARLRRNIWAFLSRVWSSGALQGRTSEQTEINVPAGSPRCGASHHGSDGSTALSRQTAVFCWESGGHPTPPTHRTRNIIPAGGGGGGPRRVRLST